MKKLASVILIASLVMVGICSCKGKETKPEVEEANEPKQTISKVVVTPEADMSFFDEEQLENSQDIEPTISQIRNICQLATLKVYFHNVAKATKEPGTGLSGFNQVSRRFWVEYSGSAELGIDMGRVDMSIDGDVINITLPPVEMIGSIQVDSDSYNLNSVIIEDEDWYRRSNEITANDLTAAINYSNESVKADILSDNMVMLQAEERSKELIENYINQISAMSGKTYTINWVNPQTN